MSDPSTEANGQAGMIQTGSDLGRFPRPELAGGLQAGDIVAAGLGLVWLLLVGGFFLFAGRGDGGGGALGTIMVLVAIFLPLALIWVAAVTSRTARAMRTEAARLQAAVDAMRQTLAAQNAATRPSVERRLEEIATAAKQAETAIVSFTSRRDGDHAPPKPAITPPTGAPDGEQPALALGTPPEALAAPLSVPDFIRALNFPDSQDDKDGIAALRRALDDRGLAKLIRAAQDVLTLLGQDGIYMDDLRPDRARPEVWRRFARGERGKAIAALGGVRDRSSLALAAGRMRNDTIFRDAAHHFLRQFDRAFSGFEPNAGDQDISGLADTRTARAFMLLGRVAGTFD
ncbi:MAG: hypothetical protein JSR87_06795 [Proteobacteria bacterium]|nr:hypothetical protein [Pseudomonadota bacterium]MBS0572714.1 hypothetical protein [Pseudomonadota bacterium]